MKWIFFLLFCFELAAEDFAWESSDKALISPPVTLTQELPIALKRDVINVDQLNAQEKERNLTIFKRKEVPWISLAAALAVSLVYVMIKMGPKRPDRLSSATAEIPQWKRALEELERLPTVKGGYDVRFSQLDQVLRLYFSGKYQFKALSYTAEEFMEKAAQSPLLENQQRQLLIKFLKNADQFEFSRGHLTAEEYEEILKIAKELMRT